MSTSIANIVLDTPDAARSARFWATVLDWQVSDWSNQEEASVRNPDGGTALYFMQVPEGKTIKNRLHLDLTPDGSSKAEIERLIGLGATKVRHFESHTVMRDPDGNEFCVTGDPNS
jgi:catechol 2,3-dioxygenase-like lactoylglutathione lyase family enzyme